MKGQNLLTDRTGIVITLGAVITLALHMFFPNLKIDGIGLSLVVLAMLPWLLPLLGRYLASGKILGQEFTFLQKRVNEQGRELESQRKIIQLIYEALRKSLTKYEYQHLDNLASNKSSNYKYSKYLEDDMMRLYQYGYVKETFLGSTGEMSKKGDQKFDLKEFYEISDEGKKHLQMLQDLGAKI